MGWSKYSCCTLCTLYRRILSVSSFFFCLLCSPVLFSICQALKLLPKLQSLTHHCCLAYRHPPTHTHARTCTHARTDTHVRIYSLSCSLALSLPLLWLSVVDLTHCAKALKYSPLLCKCVPPWGGFHYFICALAWQESESFWQGPSEASPTPALGSVYFRHSTGRQLVVAVFFSFYLPLWKNRLVCSSSWPPDWLASQGWGRIMFSATERWGFIGSCSSSVQITPVQETLSACLCLGGLRLPWPTARGCCSTARDCLGAVQLFIGGRLDTVTDLLTDSCLHCSSSYKTILRAWLPIFLNGVLVGVFAKSDRADVMHWLALLNISRQCNKSSLGRRAAAAVVL